MSHCLHSHSPHRARSLTLAALACLVAMAGLAVAPQAAAQESEVDEYVPFVPEADGRDRGDRGGEELPPSTAEELRELGPEGVAAAEFAEQTSPRAEGGGKAEDAKPPAAAVVETVAGDSGGMGILLPVLLAVALALAAAYAIRRRRAGAG